MRPSFALLDTFICDRASDKVRQEYQKSYQDRSDARDQDRGGRYILYHPDPRIGPRLNDVQRPFDLGIEKFETEDDRYGQENDRSLDQRHLEYDGQGDRRQGD